MHRIAVLGGGSFGTVLAHLMAEKGQDVRLWVRSEQVCQEINTEHKNQQYLPDIDLHSAICATPDLDAALHEVEVVIVGVPGRSFREVSRLCAQAITDSCLGVVSATKSIETENFLLMSEVLKEELQAAGKKQSVGVVSGPNLALEIAQGQYAGTVVSSHDERLTQILKDCLISPTFRVYTNPDTHGVELGGALKNIYAIAFGIADGLGVGRNTQSLLLTRSLSEIGRFATARGADPMTFLGLAGVGDLFATATSSLSRNYSIGRRLAAGMSLEEAEKHSKQTAEGVVTLKSVVARARAIELNLPIAEALHGLLFDSVELPTTISKLMTIDMDADVDFAGVVTTVRTVIDG